jgi:dihydrofolate synthase/folylpolyglutamate synthase
LWLDGGHNAAAGETLAAVAGEWRNGGLHLIFGMLNSKEPTEFLRPLATYAIGLHGVAIPNEEASLSSSEATEAGRAVGISAALSDGVTAAIKTIVGQNPAPGRILICGSLYLAGQVLAENG